MSAFGTPVEMRIVTDDVHAALLKQRPGPFLSSGTYATAYVDVNDPTRVIRVSKPVAPNNLLNDGYFHTLTSRPQLHPLLPVVYSVVVFISDTRTHYEVSMERLLPFDPSCHMGALRRTFGTTKFDQILDNVRAGKGRVDTQLIDLFNKLTNYPDDINEENIMVRSGLLGDTVVLLDPVGQRIPSTLKEDEKWLQSNNGLTHIESSSLQHENCKTY